MKKLFPIAAIALVGMMFTSCKKDYTCTCTTTKSGFSNTTSTMGKTTKSKATDACKNVETAANATFGAGTYSCNI